jgi:hypothetical protein
LKHKGHGTRYNSYIDIGRPPKLILAFVTEFAKEHNDNVDAASVGAYMM